MKYSKIVAVVLCLLGSLVLLGVLDRSMAGVSRGELERRSEDRHERIQLAGADDDGLGQGGGADEGTDEGDDESAEPATCPCDANTWWYFPSFNGIYCFGPVVERLSVCSPAGEEICVSNFGGTNPQQIDPAICAACREQFPTTANVAGAPGVTTTVTSCSDVLGPVASSEP